MMRTIRLAELRDLPRLMEVYAAARSFMARTGNPHQWAGGHPSMELLASDIPKKQLYVVEEGGIVHGAFAFILGEDPTYSRIDGGKWLSDAPYGTIHRIASDGSSPGMFPEVLAFCRSIQPHVRIDTHEDNKVMQHIVTKNGFQYCGIIYLENGDPRLAYELLPV